MQLNFNSMVLSQENLLILEKKMTAQKLGTRREEAKREFLGCHFFFFHFTLDGLRKNRAAHSPC